MTPSGVLNVYHLFVVRFWCTVALILHPDPDLDDRRICLQHIPNVDVGKVHVMLIELLFDNLSLKFCSLSLPRKSADLTVAKLRADLLK